MDTSLKRFCPLSQNQIPPCPLFLMNNSKLDKITSIDYTQKSYIHRVICLSYIEKLSIYVRNRYSKNTQKMKYKWKTYKHTQMKNTCLFYMVFEVWSPNLLRFKEFCIYVPPVIQFFPFLFLNFRFPFFFLCNLLHQNSFLSKNPSGS